MIAPGITAAPQPASPAAAANYDALNFADAEAACQQQCAHLTSFSSLQDQVHALGCGLHDVARVIL
jgi:hypothetical protein